MRRIVDFVSGFATQVTLALVQTAVDAINAKIPASPATTGKQDTGNTSLASIDGKIVACNTGAVTVTTCALPPDAATQTTLAALNGKVTACDTGAVVLATGAATIGKVDQGTGGASAWKVDGSAVTQPVSGSVTATISGTPAVTVSSSALPTGAATDTLQTTGNGFLSTLAGIVSAGKALVTETSAAAILAKLSSDPSTATLQSTINTNITNLRAQITATLGQAARASSLGVTLSTEDAAKVPSLGQALAASSVPVVLTAIQVAQLAQTGQLPAALGTQASSAALCVVRSVPLIDKQSTLATAGKVIKASAGICYGLTSYFNNTGGAIFFHVYNTIAAPTAGDRPDYFSASIANGTKSSLGFGITALGIGCPTGITFVASSTQDTFTALASTAVIYALQYD